MHGKQLNIKFISSTFLQIIIIDTLLQRPSLHSTLHPTTLHYTFRHFHSSHLNFSQIHFTNLSFGLTPFKFPTTPFHLTSLHFLTVSSTCLSKRWCCQPELRQQSVWVTHQYTIMEEEKAWLPKKNASKQMKQMTPMTRKPPCNKHE